MLTSSTIVTFIKTVSEISASSMKRKFAVVVTVSTGSMYPIYHLNFQAWKTSGTGKNVHRKYKTLSRANKYANNLQVSAMYTKEIA
ncbi:16646_t:CDS:2 [Funneliformis caledonium]|uniref:16646_t:CDS:1 n=1 Tax=Funneliformis caledonium TaxID=1117310 RepID=A0A9N8YX29_9GLOM|nr:16646_t:CDS:2 [Funneliformis caledonium]